MKYIDLHTHSNKSDGSMSPSELVCHAKESGLAAVALTDHDGIDGLPEALETGERIGFEVVPGIELSASSETETHILGYYIDINNLHLISTLSQVKQMRVKRNIDTAEKLQANGFDITVEDAQKYAGTDMLARAHFAKVMVERGYAASVQEAFDRYLSNGRPCYSGMQLLNPAECIELIRAAGGMAFAAHLHLIRKSDEDLYSFLKELKRAGLCGIEGYYTDYTPEMQSKYMAMAGELGLQISGGTDFHGGMKPHISIGTGLGNMQIPYSVLANLKRRKH